MMTQIDAKPPNVIAFHDGFSLVFPEQLSSVKEQAEAIYPHLAGKWPNGQKFQIAVTQKNFVIGRALHAHLVVPESASYVSNRHFQIHRMPSGYAIVDLNSTNGTFLNGFPIVALDARRLRDGDMIQIGPKEDGLTFHFHV